LAVLAAVAFGATTPVVSAAAKVASPFTISSLLYAGASFAAFLLGRRPDPKEAPLRAAHLPRLAAIAVLGACVAPVALAWGLARTGATTGALLLNFEALFTVLLARAVYHEPIGRRVALALVATTIAGTALAFQSRGAEGILRPLGALAIGLATFAWAADNTLTRRLADVRPLSVVAAKGALGALLTTSIALAMRAQWPGVGLGLGLMVAGAAGYGASLVLYLRAQRILGAGRTGSLFALAPFVGAGIAAVVERTTPTASHGLAGLLFGIAVVLHGTERHAHAHRHAPEAHEHAHRHDDGHHDHAHAPGHGSADEHSHPHEHTELAHTHDHTPDLHHEHTHET